MSNTMTRAEMTDALLQADLTFQFDDHFHWWFETILRDGFKGYRHMTDAELAAELAERVANGHIVLAASNG